LALATGIVLLIPLVAMQLTSEVDWNAADFVVVGVLVFRGGLAYELLTRFAGRANRIVIALLLVAALIFVWLELAVGIVGSPLAGD